MTTPRQQGTVLIEEVLKELENPKGNLSAAVKKLKRAAMLLDESDLIIWCDIQLGNSKYVSVLQKFLDAYVKNEKNKTKLNQKALDNASEEVASAGIILGKNISSDELNARLNESGGGFLKIDFIEERYNDLVRVKKGNDGTYYKNNLNHTLSTIKVIAHKYAANIYKKYAFKELTETNFEILKKNVEDVLFELHPELAEKLMIAFRSVSSDNPEEWSHALATCRRFFEQLADILYPPVVEKIKGRDLGKGNYINRLWAFMDKSIESETNKEIAKAHVDFLGTYLQTLYKVSNKGVHAGLTRLEALKAVMHIYLMCADLLNYLDKKDLKGQKPNIHVATLDEIESFANITRTIAKEIIKLRVANPALTPELLKTIPKLGPKSLKSIIDNFIFEPVTQ
ncbi:MAG TPA: helix-hairpin-helix domain-containing protein [Patescibacteria group bacterium]|nr:helix-hairpin-helix domain-containing protein [Patescibacteria group bacterium]